MLFDENGNAAAALDYVGEATGTENEPEGYQAPDISNMSVESEDLPSLADFAQEPSQGAWPVGWYKATVIEGYAAKSGFQFATEDKASSKGDSRNLTVCFQVKNEAGEERNMFTSFNYRIDDFTETKRGAVKELRAHYAGKKGWAEKDLERTSLALAKLGQFGRAFSSLSDPAKGYAKENLVVKAPIKRTTQGNISPLNLIGHEIDIHLTMGTKKDESGALNDKGKPLYVETGFNEINEFAILGEKTDKKVKGRK